ncbi:MAG: hypothetical protein H0V89_12215, partial [Deltaproteobacteria bacterium]|nr:hypothetical protein [Deltaproteobacteria bacterium]
MKFPVLPSSAWGLGLSALAVVAGGCAAFEEPERADLDEALNWDDGFETVVTTNGDTDDAPETTEEVSDAMFHIDAPQTDYAIRLQTWDPDTRTVNEGEPCQINLDNLQAGDHVVQYCMMDVNELDLYVLGYPLDVNVPGGTCDFFQLDWYQYEDWYADVGPTEIAITYTPDGTIIDDTYTFLGEAFCPFDYRPFGPNCCLGDYEITVTDQLTDTVSIIPGSWGGFPGDCYDGTSYVMAPAVSEQTHLPLSEIVFIDKEAYEASYAVTQSATQYGTNVALSNYYDPADHDGDRPAGLTKPYAREYNSFLC